MTVLLDLPSELLLAVTGHIDTCRDANALALTNQVFYSIANNCLYHLEAQQDGRPGLFWALSENVVTTAKKCLDAGATCGIRRAEVFAASYDRVEIMELLIQKVTPGSRDEYPRWRTPLSVAVRNGYPKTVELLLAQKGVDVNTRDEKGCTPLVHAVKKGSIEPLRLLLKHPNTIVNHVDDPDNVPLWRAASRGRPDIVETLLAAHADPNIKGSSHEPETPVAAAARRLRDIWENGPDHAERESRETLQLLLSHPATILDWEESGIGGAYVWSAQDGWDKLFRLFLGKMDTIPEDLKTPYGKNLLPYVVTREGNENIVRMMLDQQGVPPDTPGAGGRTPLSYAAESGPVAIVRILLDTGAVEVDSKDKKGKTPLFWAVWGGQEDVLELLSSHGAVLPESKGDRGLRELFSHAVEFDEPYGMKVFLDRGETKPPIQGTRMVERSSPSPRNENPWQPCNFS